MQLSRYYRWALAIVGTVILGAVGSGLWDLIFKPIVPKLIDLVLTISTLGLAGLRDGIYVDVAYGSYERASLFVAGVVTGFFCGLAAFAIYLIKRLANDNEARPVDSTTIMEAIIKSRISNTIMMLMLLLFTVYAVINGASMSYIIQASNYIEQLQNVVAPVITEDQRLQFRSDAAQIESREDFKRIVDELYRIAQKNGLHVHQFRIF